MRELKGAHYLTLQQQYGLMLATYKEPPAGATLPPPPGSQADQRIYIMSLEMDGAGACSGLLNPDDRIVSVDGTPAENLAQVTDAFRGSSAMVKVVVASRIVFAGFMLKKGEMNSEFQLRWFMLVDEKEGPVLRYYEGRNTVSRVKKGEIKINQQELSAMLGLSRMSVNRTLKDLERRCLLTLGYKRIRIDDLTGLRDFAEAGDRPV